ncbi:MAG: methylmalonyl Co-A mutase-associated GTPase MeaB [Propionibacteriaceae bacterium]|jgi:LAO/AO transport system kinase|nr:methylmalonyl Co-A mutase-associated GTPase MeaB [Propionibacteriaceae bacterium]
MSENWMGDKLSVAPETSTDYKTLNQNVQIREPKRRTLSVDELAQKVLEGSRPHIAQAITLVESSLPAHRRISRKLLRILRPHSGKAIRVGITGVPGAGKSTFIDAMGQKLVEQGKKIAVLAIDPTSTKTGGSILGDRTRMGKLAQSDNVFIRPSPTSGQLGGVARATRETMIVMEAAGYDVTMIETVGVGQSEVAVAGMVDTFLLILLAGAGDQLQGIKRGILEMADIVTINKADGDNEGEARVAARDLKIALKLITSDPNARRAPVLTSSSVTGKGLDEIWQAVLDHRKYLEETGQLEKHRADQQLQWLWALVKDELEDALRESDGVKAIRKQMEDDVVSGETSALEASAEILQAYVKDLPAIINKDEA